MSNSLLRHAAMVCENARAGLPTQFPNGVPVAMPNQEAQAVFAGRAARFAVVANKLDKRVPLRAAEIKIRATRRLPAAANTTGNLTALEVHPRFGRNTNPSAMAEKLFAPPSQRIRSFGADR